MAVENIFRDIIYPASCCDRHRLHNKPRPECTGKGVFVHEMADWVRESP